MAKVMDEDLLKSAIAGKMRTGKNALIKYLKGGRLTPRQVMYAKCYDCNGMGDQDTCDVEGCSLYPYSQFNETNKEKRRGK